MFESPLADLARAEVAFITVGGLAVAQAGHPRFTENIDVLVDASPGNLGRLIATLSTFGDGAAAELVPSDFPVEEGAVRIIEDVVIDVFTLTSGQTYADLLPLTTLHDIDGVDVRFLSAAGLIRLKAPSLRPKDQTDAAELARILAESRGPDRDDA